MNFPIKVILHYLCAWQDSGYRDVIRDGCHCLPGLYCSPENFSCTSNGLPDKKLKHCYVNVNYKNISYYVLFVFIILT